MAGHAVRVPISLSKLAACAWALSLATGCAPSIEDGGGGGGAGGAGCNGEGWTPTPADIAFQPASSLLGGEMILFNDNRYTTYTAKKWSTSGALRAIPAGGGAVQTVFNANTVWSFAVAPKSHHVVFSAAPTSAAQLEHYCDDVVNGIEPAWLWDENGEPTHLDDGKNDDDSFVFSADEDRVYFSHSDEQERTARIGSIELATGTVSFVTPASTETFSAWPAIGGKGEMLFERYAADDTIDNTEIWSESLATEDAVRIFEHASEPTFSPDRTRFAFKDWSDGGALYVANPDGSGRVKISSIEGDAPAWSPDGSRIAFTFKDAAHQCWAIDVVAADGSDAPNPKRVFDCTNEFISALAWVDF